jgi:hypothetical protein
MEKSNYTHTLWMPYYFKGHFFRWYEAGMGYVTIDENGIETPHIFEHMYSRSNPSGYSCFLPNGIKPPDLTEKKKPSRPAQQTASDDEKF